MVRMVMVQNTYGTKLQFCGTKWFWYEMTSFALIDCQRTWRSVLLVDKTTDLSQVTDKLIT
jgi:hypothetical protein